MDNKLFMKNLLLITNNLIELLYHGAIESDKEDINDLFITCLEDSLVLQHEIYLNIKQIDYCETQNAKQEEINKVYQKFKVQ